MSLIFLSGGWRQNLISLVLRLSSSFIMKTQGEPDIDVHCTITGFYVKKTTTQHGINFPMLEELLVHAIQKSSSTSLMLIPS